MEVRLRRGELLTLKFKYRTLRVAVRVIHGFVQAWEKLCTVTVALYDRAKFNLVRLRVHYLVEVSESAKCPACGIRQKHKIQWVDDYQSVMHECARCKAHWGEKPVAKLEAWKVKPMPMPDEEQSSEEVKTTSKIRQVV